MIDDGLESVGVSRQFPSQSDSEGLIDNISIFDSQILPGILPPSVIL